MNDFPSQRADRVERSAQATTLPRHAAARVAERGEPRLAALVSKIAFAAEAAA